VLSTFIGIALSAIIVAGYLYRNRNPHMRLRTSDLSFHGLDPAFDDDSSSGYAAGAANSSASSRGREVGGGNLLGGSAGSNRGLVGAISDMIWGDTCVSYIDDVDSALEMSENRSSLRGDSSSGSGAIEGSFESSNMKRMLQNIREQSSHGKSSSPGSNTGRVGGRESSSSANYLDFDSTSRSGEGGSSRRSAGGRDVYSDVSSPMTVRSLAKSGDGL
jgi:hypothetical protein